MMFMSPELLMSKSFGFMESAPMPEADIYVLGLVIYQVCEQDYGYLSFTYMPQALLLASCYTGEILSAQRSYLESFGTPALNKRRVRSDTAWPLKSEPLHTKKRNEAPNPPSRPTSTTKLQYVDLRGNSR